MANGMDLTKAGCCHWCGRTKDGAQVGGHDGHGICAKGYAPVWAPKSFWRTGSGATGQGPYRIEGIPQPVAMHVGIHSTCSALCCRALVMTSSLADLAHKCPIAFVSGNSSGMHCSKVWRLRAT